jgi:hypothetical protein
MGQQLTDILSRDDAPALLLGNGINRIWNNDPMSWEHLLSKLAENRGVALHPEELAEMSNTELYDLLDLAKPNTNKDNLQVDVRDLMRSWKPTHVHEMIVAWATRRSAPVLTVNFDENLSASHKLKLHVVKQNNHYPFHSHFAHEQAEDPLRSFGIWHPHGMLHFRQSIRLGLTHYMGSVQKVRDWMVKSRALLNYADGKVQSWPGQRTWLQIILFKPLLIIGFGFGKEETFMRWLLLERARLYATHPFLRKPCWFVDVQSPTLERRKAFLSHLGIEVVSVEIHADIYDDQGWRY